MKPLNELLQYKNPAVVRRFARELPAYAANADQIFSDLLRFFWASKRHSDLRKEFPKNEAYDFIFIMDEEMKEVDLIWHVFLLYTQDYMDFCENYFGEYYHHLPDIVPNFKEGEFDAETNLERFLNFVYDELGEEVVERWFSKSLVE